MLSNRDNYQQQGFVPSPPSSSPTSSTVSRCCTLRRPCCGSDSKHRGKRLWLCCCCYCSSSSNSLFTSFGVFVLVLIYTLLGALIFMLLEGSNPKDHHTSLNRVKTNDEIRAETVEKLWSITEDLNILYKENWTRLAADEVFKFQETLIRRLQDHPKMFPTHHQWSFASSYLYSLTLITTIGYGNVAPSTTWGKLVTVLYSIVGIPLMLIYLSTTGEILSRHFRSAYARLFCLKAKKHKAKKQPSYMSTSYMHKNHNNIADGGKIPYGSADEILKERSVYESDRDCTRHVACHIKEPPRIPAPIFIALLIITLYITGGAYLFRYLENWTYLQGTLFCFTSLTTIGFGDLAPGIRSSALQTGAKSYSEMVSVVTTSCYILLGMAVIAMCFNLIQDQIVLILKKFNALFGGVHEFIDDQHHEIEGISMSIVSSSAS